MPVLISGQLVPTDPEFEAYSSRLSADDIPDAPTAHLPVVSQFKRPVGVWQPPPEATACPVQQSRHTDCSRTFFGVNGYKRTLTATTLADFLLFLKESGYDFRRYSEQGIVGMARCNAVNALLDEGRLRLLRAGEGSNERLFLASSLGCQDMANEFLWSQSACCPNCHSPSHSLIKHTLTDRRVAMLCCSASQFIEDFPRLPHTFPPCEWDDVGEDPPDDFDMSLLD